MPAQNFTSGLSHVVDSHLVLCSHFCKLFKTRKWKYGQIPLYTSKCNSKVWGSREFENSLGEAFTSELSFQGSTLRSSFGLFQVCFTVGGSINNLGSGRFSILVLCDSWRNCFAICIPEVISILEVTSISWTICVGKHGNGPKQLISEVICILEVNSISWTIVLASMEVSTSRLRMARFELCHSNFFQVGHL